MMNDTQKNSDLSSNVINPSTGDAENSEPVDPKVRKVGDHILGTMKAAMIKAIAHHAEPSQYPLPTDPKAVEHIFAQQLRGQRPEQQAIAVAKVKALLTSSPTRQARAFGGMTHLNLRVAIPVEQQAVSNLPAALRLEASDLRRLAAREAPPQAPAQATATKTAAKKKTPYFKFDLEKHTRLALMLRYVQCKEETDEMFSDQIKLVAMGVDGAGNIVKPNPITISNDFDKGEYVEYGDTKPLLVFNLNDKAKWPKTCQAKITLVESDGGDLTGTITKLVEWAKGAGTNYTAGKAGEYIDPEVSANVAQYVFSKLGDLLLGFLGAGSDAVAPEVSLTCRIDSPLHTFPHPNTPYATLGVKSNFYMDGGHYVIATNWKLLP